MVMATKETVWSLRYSQYQARNCGEEGRIRMDNMTKSERRGFVKLNKRIKLWSPEQTKARETLSVHRKTTETKVDPMS